MVRRRGPRLTLAEKTELWRRWRRGESLNAIGRALGRIAHVVRYEVARTGGIPPPARQRSRLALTLTEREAISRGRASGTSVRQISRQLRRAPSTVSREVCRHGGRRRYRAATADAVAWARGRRPKRCRLATHPALRDAVATKLTQKWSPQQIAGWLRRAYPDDPTMHVSHETIYLSLFVQSRGVLKKALQAQLRQRRTIRRPRTAPRPSGGYIVGAVSIRERPATVEDRAVPGHWEGDLLVGARQSYVATLVERCSRYVCLVRVSGLVNVANRLVEAGAFDDAGAVHELNVEYHDGPAGVEVGDRWNEVVAVGARSTPGGMTMSPGCAVARMFPETTTTIRVAAVGAETRRTASAF